MHDTKERLSLFWIFALLNYLYADVLAVFAFVGSNSAPHLPRWVLLGSAVLMEIPIAMIVACRLLPFGANRLANIIAGTILTLVNAFATFVLPLTNGAFRDPIYPAYVFFAALETVCTVGHHLAGVDLAGGEATHWFGARRGKTRTRRNSR